jgi:regulator of PEP synthase PpsR (kinase-PPPase family)
MSMDNMQSVFFISDRTGITTKAMGQALLTQFPNIQFKYEFIPFVDTEHKLQQTLVKIQQHHINSNQRVIVFTSIMNDQIRNQFKLDYICHIDFFEAFLPQLEQELQQTASKEVGVLRGMQQNEAKYYQRINAINFALDSDDGIPNSKIYQEADVILVGISRVGKTPICLYLAVNYGIKTANYPFVELDLEQESLPQLLQPHYAKIFGLTIDADRLHFIRTNRVPNSQYADLNNCRKEITSAEKIMLNNAIPYLNVSKRSIEEMSVAILQHFRLNEIKS